MVAAAKKKRPKALPGTTYRIKTGCGTMWVTITEEAGAATEIFLKMGKAGGCVSAVTETIGRVSSQALKAGMTLEDLATTLTGISCQQPWPKTDDDDGSSSCCDAIAKILKAHAEKARE